MVDGAAASWAQRGRGMNGETGGVDVPARTGLRVVYLDTDAKTNGTIKLNSSQTPVARLSSSLASRDSPALDRENAIPTYVYVCVCVCTHYRIATGQSFVIKSGIDPLFQIFP